MPDVLQGRRVLIYVSGSVAAFKAGLVITALRERGAEVRVAMTRAAQNFITPTTLQALSGNPVVTSLFDDAADAGHGMEHLSLSAWAEVQVAVAASANLIARLALGLADDAVTATALACPAPLLLAPAMEAAMWQHDATQEHVDTLTSRGAHLVGPVVGRLASGKHAEGRMAEADAIVTAIAEMLGR